MWLTPNSSSVARIWSARSWLTRHIAAAPKITRLLACPVRPKLARSIIAAQYPRLQGEESSASGNLSTIPTREGGVVLSPESFANEFDPDHPPSPAFVPDRIVADGLAASASSALMPAADDVDLDVAVAELVYHEELDVYVRRQGSALRRSAFLLTG